MVQKDNRDEDPTRRAFLRGAALGLTAGGLTLVEACKYEKQLFLLKSPPKAESQRPEWATSQVQSYRPLGRTAFRMSDISQGTSGLADAAVARRAVERGITYFDTSPDYSHAGSEKALGEGIKGTPRDKLFLVSKFCTEDGHLANDTPVDGVMAAVEASLRRLGTDYLDLCHIHACNSVDRLMAPSIHEAFDRLKQAGKVRFLGVSSHTPDLETVMSHAVDSGRFDVIMVAYNFKNWPDLHDIFHRAHEKGVGVVAMKTLKGAKHTNLAPFRREAGSYAQSAFRWVLSNADVSCLVVSFAKPQHVDEYLAASGTELTPADEARLRAYDTLVAGDYCQPHCGVCLPSCPHELAVHDVLRYRMYAKDYGWEREGMRLYAALDRDAHTCLTCPAPCAGSCPHGVPIRATMLDAHRTLALPTRA
jgi:predicted aldo/keto reductase-like oxidoreductase